MVKRSIILAAVLLAVAGCGSSKGDASFRSDASSTTTPPTAAPDTAPPSVVPSSGPTDSSSHHGSSGNSGSVDTIKVSKCYTDGASELLIKASSSDKSAHLLAYRPDGTLIGEVQNGGGSRYGGTNLPGQPSDPIEVTIKSSSGGIITVRTTRTPTT